MLCMRIIITSPSLDFNQNVSGISAVTNFIIKSNPLHQYEHFEIGKQDDEKRNILWLLRIFKMYLKWFILLILSKDVLVHFNFPVNKRSIIRDVPMIMLCKLLSKRLIIHFHGGEFLMKKDIPQWAIKALKYILGGKNPKVVLSDKEKNFITNAYQVNNLVVLPNCIDLEEAEKFTKNLTAEEIPVLLFLGRICLEKGLEEIYLALKLLKEQGLNFKFCLAGKGPDQNKYLSKFSKLLGNDFDFKGVVSGDEKINVLKNSTIFLLPSYNEGLPIALLEAMSFNIVPIVTNVGSVASAVKNKENGILLEINSSEDIAKAVTELVNNKKYLQLLSSNAKQLIFENYNPIFYIEKLNNIYQYE